jgi:hypothetical protein
MRIPRSRSLFEELEARFLADTDDSAVERFVPAVRSRGWLTKPEFRAVCRWKTPRTAPLVRRNSPSQIRDATAFALETPDERLRIGSLLGLRGVSWPTASVVLHFFHRDPYPVLDVRATCSLGMRPPSAYSFEFWERYVHACRDLSRRLRLSMRTVDRALWQYSRERS